MLFCFAFVSFIKTLDPLLLQVSPEGTVDATNSEQICSVSGESEEDDDSFEKYLEKLRLENSKPEDKRVEGAHDQSFIVSDSDVSIIESDSESEESDSSWCGSGSSSDKREPGTRRKHLVKNIADSFKSPSVLSGRKKKELDPDEHFLLSLSANYSGARHPDAQVYVKKGIKNETRRTELTGRLVEIFRRECFKEELPEHLPVTWNPRLRKTAGMCRNKSDRSSWIELSPKVCNTPGRKNQVYL
ncbi:hypothetical protein OESDEN_09594 [Oesophagostomum dentatum]|uniref:SprT-like domain-containing protein n=1 Tax=Oesophagostomum dentatum TaxID=61180 RepID=A0A0B1T452_OESDE|nr:hypothetical protein OESDEN_09594 [Oesophagostomum dentatum]